MLSVILLIKHTIFRSKQIELSKWILITLSVNKDLSCDHKLNTGKSYFNKFLKFLKSSQYGC